MTRAKKINLQYGGLLLKKRLKFSFVKLLVRDYGIAAVTLLTVISQRVQTTSDID